MQIAAVQLDMVWENKLKNHQRVEELLSQAAPEPNTLIILPEMFDTGFSMNTAKTAQSEQRESESFLRAIALRFQCAVMGGVAGPIVGGLSSNECVVFAPDGAELVRYRKMQPFTLTGEDQHYGRGVEHRIFEWQGVKIAPFICYDLRFPELFRAALDDGAEMFTVIACWPAVRSEHWVRLLQARAIENLALTVGVNRSGEEPQLKFDGRSAAFNHMGASLLEADAAQAVHRFEFDVQAMRKWREKFPALRDRVRLEPSGSC